MIEYWRILDAAGVQLYDGTAYGFIAAADLAGERVVRGCVYQRDGVWWASSAPESGVWAGGPTRASATWRAINGAADVYAGARH